MKRRLGSIVLSAGAAMTLSACATLNVDRLPAPGNSFSDGYPIVMEFDNVLNLPSHAKVTLDGRAVGIVTNVAIVGSHVDVTSRIDGQVKVPANIHATLQQATVLGDIYVALERSADPAAGSLASGARLTLAQTTSPTELENTIAHLADFVGSGSIQRVQNTIVGLNRITPPTDDLRRMASRFATDMSELANNVDNVDVLLNKASEAAAVMHDRLPSYQYWFSPEGMRGFDRVLQATSLISNGVPSLGSIYRGGFWLVPFLNSAADAAGAAQRSKWAFESEVPRWRKLFTDYFLPQDKYPAINITSIVGPDGRELSGNVQDVLRILGAMP